MDLAPGELAGGGEVEEALSQVSEGEHAGGALDRAVKCGDVADLVERGGGRREERKERDFVCARLLGCFVVRLLVDRLVHA